MGVLVLSETLSVSFDRNVVVVLVVLLVPGSTVSTSRSVCEITFVARAGRHEEGLPRRMTDGPRYKSNWSTRRVHRGGR